MNKDVKALSQRCQSCVERSPSNKKEPEIAHEKAVYPFQQIHMDFCNYTGQQWLAIGDQFSAEDFHFFDGLERKLFLQMSSSISRMSLRTLEFLKPSTVMVDLSSSAKSLRKCAKNTESTTESHHHITLSQMDLLNRL
jgi:hypothetical protein